MKQKFKNPEGYRSPSQHWWCKIHARSGQSKLFLGSANYTLDIHVFVISVSSSNTDIIILTLNDNYKNYSPLDLNELASKDGVRSGCFSCLKTRSGANGAARDTAGRDSPRVSGGRGCSSKSRFAGSW